MGTTKTLGGDRIGSGRKMQVELKNYERSTHNLGYLWRSSMAAGTLVPFMVEPAMPGDTWDISLGCEVKTHPTLAPLFGSFKVQLDVYQVPIRLYQAQLHNNKLYIGMKMENIKLPQLHIEAPNLDVTSRRQLDVQQINPSSLLAYLGIRGIGMQYSNNYSTVARDFEATPYLAYWDIYKNYYANKQEEIGAMIHTGSAVNTSIVLTTIWNGSTPTTVPSVGSTDINFTANNNLTIQGLNLVPENINLKVKEAGGDVVNKPLMEVYGKFSNNANRTILVAYEPNTNVYTKIQAAFTAADATVTDPKLAITTFPLSNLDDMREDILAAIKNVDPFKINGSTYTPYGLPLMTIGSKLASIYSQEGLALKTYQSDIFNNWLNTTWLDGAGGITAITSVAVADNKFSIDTLNLAKKVYNLLNRIAVSGGSYEDWIEAAYDIEPSRKAETPMYVGGLSKELVFSEVVSNSATDVEGYEPIGTLAGKGTMAQRTKGGKCVIKVQEHSYIIGIISLTPRVDYSQGNRWYTNIKNMNDWHKPALDQIGFQDLITEQMAFWDTLVGDPGEQEPALTFRSAGKQPAWINYQTNFNRAYGNFADNDKEMFMTLNRRYEVNPETKRIKDLTTYIDPSKFNYAFAQTELDAQNFWVHIGVDADVRRKMSAKIMPNP